MILINRQQYMAELTRLLGFMSSWDREAAITKLDKMFDEAESEAVMINSLGSPTRMAIAIARDYVPTPSPEAAKAAEPVPAPAEEAVEETPAPADETATDVPAPEEAAVEEPAPAEETVTEEVPAPAEETAAEEASAPAEEPVTEEVPAPVENAAAEEEPVPAEGTAEDAPAPAEETAEEAPVSREETPGEEEESAPVFGRDTEIPAETLKALEQAIERAQETESAPAETLREVPAPAETVELIEAEEPSRAPAAPVRYRRKLRPLALIAYIPVAIAIGLPVTVLLVALGVPFVVLGGGVIAGAVYGATRIVGALSLFSDILLAGGSALALCGVGLLILLLGVWISVRLGTAWLDGVVFRLGRRLCYKKEAIRE